jgi:ADP-ribose diphosphatase
MQRQVVSRVRPWFLSATVRPLTHNVCRRTIKTLPRPSLHHLRHSHSQPVTITVSVSDRHTSTQRLNSLSMMTCRSPPITLSSMSCDTHPRHHNNRLIHCQPARAVTVADNSIHRLRRLYHCRPTYRSVSDPVLYEAKYMRVRCNGNKWEYVERPNGIGVVAIVACTTNDELVLIEQYRQAVQCNVLELPAGLVGDDAKADPIGAELIAQGRASTESDELDAVFERAARRELEEETGFGKGTWQYGMTAPSSAGLTSELITFFVAHDVEKVSDSMGEPDEHITAVHTVPMDQLFEFVQQKRREGLLIDAKIFAGQALAKQ